MGAWDSDLLEAGLQVMGPESVSDLFENILLVLDTHELSEKVFTLTKAEDSVRSSGFLWRSVLSSVAFG